MAKDEKSGSKRVRLNRGRDKAKPQTKIVIRNLPPSMTEEEFLKQIDPLPDHDFYYFAEADWSLGFDATCRAYITFKNYDDVFLFRDRFDGYVFVDNKGNEYPGIVEFAPFQGFLKNKSRNSDNKVNTIEQELHYQQFLKKLEEEREAAAKGGEMKLEFSLDSKKEEITSTPLLQYLASKREKRRDDAKKRSAEKKRRREEDKEKRKQNHVTVQPVRVLTAEASSKKSEKVEQSNHAKEEPKNARARRREQRNRLRHEAFLQKKQAGHNTTTQKEAITLAKKEENNKNDKENRNDSVSSLDANKAINVLKKDKTDELTESVRNFILTAATNIPIVATDDKNEEDSTRNESQSLENLSDMQDKLFKLDISKNYQNSDEDSHVFKEAKDQTRREKLTQKKIDENRDERRIRNKDRPSIAIYQPKPRLRLSEDGDVNTACKEFARSQSVSDGDAKKSEEPRHKKVQRYSERSKNRKISKEISDDALQTTHMQSNPNGETTTAANIETSTDVVKLGTEESEFCNMN